MREKFLCFIHSSYLCSRRQKMQSIMKKNIYFIIAFCTFLTTEASAQQQVSFGPLHSPDSPCEEWLLPGDTVYQAGKPMIYQGKPVKNAYMTPARLSDKKETLGKNGLLGDASLDSTYYNNPISNLTNGLSYPLGYGWGLHKGLNLSVDLSAFATFGKNVPHRGGFTQTIDATYLTPLTKDNKLWLALGTYINNVNYGGDSYHDGGVYGILGYQFNEHWEAYVYGQLSVANNYNSLYGRYGSYGYGPYGYSPWGYGMYPWGMGRGIMPGGYGMGVPGANVLGAGVRYTNSKKTFSIGLNVEGVWYDNKTPAYFKQYDYPVPKAPEKD